MVRTAPGRCPADCRLEEEGAAEAAAVALGPHAAREPSEGPAEPVSVPQHQSRHASTAAERNATTRGRRKRVRYDAWSILHRRSSGMPRMSRLAISSGSVARSPSTCSCSHRSDSTSARRRSRAVGSMRAVYTRVQILTRRRRETQCGVHACATLAAPRRRLCDVAPAGFRCRDARGGELVESAARPVLVSRDLRIFQWLRSRPICSRRPSAR